MDARKIVTGWFGSKQVVPKATMLNLGCGGSFHSSWVNVDVVATHPSVIRHDLRQLLPFPDAAFEAVYHSHVLEHLSREQGRFLIVECWRVLQPGGLIRAAVPDLETICRLYLRYLEEAVAGQPGAAEKYEWITLELMDQMVREYTGGQMAEYWAQEPMPAEEFVLERMGQEVKGALTQLRRAPKGEAIRKPQKPSQAALFRQSGEVHKWMYDRYSLAKLLKDSGFVDVLPCSAYTSRIPNFGEYRLDTTEDGSVRKPDSLFMEAVKPVKS